MTSLRRPFRLIMLSLVALSCFSIAIKQAGASLRMGGKGLVCIEVYELAEDGALRSRKDLGEYVSTDLQTKLTSHGLSVKVRAQPNCIKPDQLGFDRQLQMVLSVKKQTKKVDNREWNVLVAGGTSPDGLFQDRELQPVLIVQQDVVSDVVIVDALNKFVDQTIVTALTL